MKAIKDILGKWSTVSQPWQHGTEPLEIRQAILAEVVGKVTAAGPGKRIFPYGRVRVTVLVDGADERARFEAAVEEAWGLEEAIREGLEQKGATPPAGLTVEVEITEEGSEAFAGRRYRIAYERAAAGSASRAAASPAPEPAAPKARPALALTVLRGEAAETAYRFTTPRVLMGRLDEVLDEAGRVKRRNDIAFLDQNDEINRTVSREHARITWDEEGACFWLRAEAQGVRIFRGGDPIEVSRHDRRGVCLKDGDEIYLGRAALRVGLGGEGG